MYDVTFYYDVEDEFDSVSFIATVHEDKVFDTWEEVIAYRDELRSCPWISNISVIDNTVDI